LLQSNNTKGHKVCCFQILHGPYSK
jgi:hypothetical protein